MHGILKGAFIPSIILVDVLISHKSQMCLKQSSSTFLTKKNILFPPVFSLLGVGESSLEVGKGIIHLLCFRYTLQNLAHRNTCQRMRIEVPGSEASGFSPFFNVSPQLEVGKVKRETMW